ncbi:hypothetical protein B0H17DRAFT_1145831 [Mycena rosella]|uniref:Uncharacterized protein n=1 Tax=Mycena rosella TaxID=1033263 RepID=A0AAD7CQ43_MYCRO|nr:hypothetical protein B0H17DRAFT_1145831 [Mycena rosella]
MHQKSARAHTGSVSPTQSNHKGTRRRKKTVCKWGRRKGRERGIRWKGADGGDARNRGTSADAGRRAVERGKARQASEGVWTRMNTDATFGGISIGAPGTGNAPQRERREGDAAHEEFDLGAEGSASVGGRAREEDRDRKP